METRARQSTRGPRTLKRGQKYILWMYMMMWYSRFLIYCLVEDGIRRKTTINQAWSLHCFGFWRLQDSTRQKDDRETVGFHLNCNSYRWVVVEGGMMTKNATTNWIFIKNIFDVLSRFGWQPISCQDGLSADILGYRCIRMDATVPMTHVDVNEGE